MRRNTEAPGQDGRKRAEDEAAHGYSGRGGILFTLGGALLAEAAAGNATRFDRFAGIAPGTFLGGSALHGPLHVLGMLWDAIRDTLG